MQKTILALALAVALALAATAPANASQVIYEAVVDITSGDLNGQSFTAIFDFDDIELSGLGEEALFVNSLTFGFEGETFTEADGDAEVFFFDGEFLGLGYSVDTPSSFSFIPGFFEIDEAFFSYEGITLDGVGDITYTVVPVPAAAYLLGAGLVGLLAARRKA